MKNLKKSVISFVLAICLIIPCVFMLSACGKDKDHNSFILIGKTVQGTSECFIIWNEDVTEQEKLDYFAIRGEDTNTEEKLISKLKLIYGENYCTFFKNNYNKDGTVIIQKEGEEKVIKYYKELTSSKSVAHYEDAECLNKVNGDINGPALFEFVNDKYCAVFDDYDLFKIYIVFKLV